jgi:hypothetical protein
VPTEKTEVCLHSLKWTLAKKIWGSDGSCGEGIELADASLIPFLEGIIEGNGGGDMGRDAQRLISAIKQYGKVQLCIHS